VSTPRSHTRGSDRPRRDRDPSTEVHLGDGIVRELSASARPGKSEILVKVFAEAMSAYADGDLDRAVRLGEQAKQLALRSTNVREFLGLAYYSAERWKEAARELAAFRRMSGSTAQNHVIADCYRAQGKPEKALEYCDDMDITVPEEVHYEGQIVAAGALADMGRLEDAVGRLLRLDLTPNEVSEHHLRVWYVLADLLERLGRFTQAKRWFQAVIDNDAELTDAEERLAKLR
jgi:tetratricopeptide (TPR) repeat protein